MGQTLLLLPALDSSTGREISSQWGHRTPLQTGDQSLPCPGIQPHLCFTAAGAFWEKQCDHNGSVLPSLHTLPSLHHLLGLKAALQSFKVIPLPQGTKGHDWLIAVPFDLGQTLLKSPRLFPQTATFCKHHPPINMAHLKLQGFDTRNGKPMKNKKRCIQCLTSHLVARWGSRVAPLLSWALQQNTGCSLEHGSSLLPTLLPSFGLFLESRQPSLSRTNTNFTPPLTPVIFSKFLKSKILKNIQKTQR